MGSCSLMSLTMSSSAHAIGSRAGAATPVRSVRLPMMMVVFPFSPPAQPRPAVPTRVRIRNSARHTLVSPRLIPPPFCVVQGKPEDEPVGDSRFGNILSPASSGVQSAGIGILMRGHTDGRYACWRLVAVRFVPQRGSTVWAAFDKARGFHLLWGQTARSLVPADSDRGDPPMPAAGPKSIRETKQKIRILLADDHRAFREGLSRILGEEEGLEIVAVAGDGEEAVKLASELQPDVAIVDVAMPRLSGIEAISHVKARSPGTAIIVLSAYDYESYVLPSMEAGASAYLLKTVGVSEIARAVRAVQDGQTVLGPTASRRLLSRIAGAGGRV
ncbi:MAG: response regulator transcription factor, partial [Chloroflexi bacterium]|nr:response regulator transcription factor [Chloroflexota bacterium]